ncbi:GMC family oxidoreductase [Dactylosporangium vinaceum]|uniref:Cholesterol oxidase n=1 Tax=Dactylosporangium vinaceum TaxID=53362 RepID=A0ABV5M9N3_9ACTN|nr:GMC family oxidoreductase [Dactylosporangium vinaceum]UAC00078.1 GMC family oxidoreductase [Dactylosporangium vinaceum]
MTRTRADRPLREHFDTVVVGSGFGGAVAACRLAQAGIDVAVLERGRRWPAGSFPRELGDPDQGWLWAHEQGLYDIRPYPQMLTVTAAGYGGGSLVYANVAMRAPAEVFATHWPAPYRRDTLDPYYDLAADMLAIRPVPPDPRTGQLPPKTRLLAAGGAGQGVFLPNLAVTFGAPGRPVRNRFGAAQAGCLYCGECDIGCNIAAKNSLDLNYLALAERHGATVSTRCEVVHLERLPGGGYRIHLHDHGHDVRRTVTAERVVLAAGALGSTAILLRSRDQYRTLPDLPRTLGHGYSGNGDFLAFGHGTTAPVYPDRGPTITTARLVDTGPGADRPAWFLVEDGGYSAHLARLIMALSPGRLAALGLASVARALREGRAPGPVVEAAARDASDHTVVLLSMGRDHGEGRLSLRGGHLHVDWDTTGDRPLYAAESDAAADIVRSLGGRLALPPTWRYLGRPVSVHSLGGCRMGTGPHDGVVNVDGEVFGHPGLYVLDGAILPAATGTNPSHTITAVAERCLEILIRRITGDPAWTAPGKATVARPSLPEDAVVAIRPAVPRPDVQFTEVMRGTVSVDGTAHAVAATITVAVTDVDTFLRDPDHPARAVGRVEVAGLTGQPGVTVEHGTVRMLTRADGNGGAGRARRMEYELPFLVAGRRWELRGRKVVQPGDLRRLWAATTTLPVTVTGPGRGGAGVLRLSAAGFLRQLGTFRGSPPALARYVWFFVRRVSAAAWPIRPAANPHREEFR